MNPGGGGGRKQEVLIFSNLKRGECFFYPFKFG